MSLFSMVSFSFLVLVSPLSLAMVVSTRDSHFNHETRLEGTWQAPNIFFQNLQNDQPVPAPAKAAVLCEEEIKVKLDALNALPVTNEILEEKISLMIELMKSPESNNSQSLVSPSTGSQILSPAATYSVLPKSDEATLEALQANIKQEEIKSTTNARNTAYKKARNWFIFTLGSFSLTFFSWKYNWLPEKTTYSCGAAGAFSGVMTLTWFYKNLQAQRKLDELRKK